MLWYQGKTVLETLDNLGMVREDYEFMLPIQDVYHIDGEKVFVGMVASGQISANDKVRILSSHAQTKVKTIRVFRGY
jgi:translation elongation factor EF-1alpha